MHVSGRHKASHKDCAKLPARSSLYEMHRTVTSRKMRFAKYTVEYIARKEDKTDASDLEKNLSWLVIKIEFASVYSCT